MEPNRAETQFTRALYELSVGSGTLQERLSGAWLALMAVTKDDLPTGLREAFAVVEAEVLSAPEDPDSLTDQAAAESAERILRLAVQVWQFHQ